MRWFGWLLVCIDVIFNLRMLAGMVYNIFRKDPPLTAIRTETSILISFACMGVVFVALTVVYFMVDMIVARYIR